MIEPLLGNPVKAILLKGYKPYAAMGDLLQIVRAEGSRILHCEEVRAIEIVALRNVPGYVAVVLTLNSVANQP